MPEGAMPSGEGGATPPASGSPDAGATSQGAPATGDYPDGLGDAGKKALDAEREARKAAEKLAGDNARELKKLQDAQLSEAEKRDARNKELEAENAVLRSSMQEARVRDAAIAAARKAGFWDVDVAFALIDKSSIAYDESGNPKNVDALVAAIAREKPKLVNGNTDFGGGHRGEAGGANQDMNDLIRRAAGR